MIDEPWEALEGDLVKDIENFDFNISAQKSLPVSKDNFNVSFMKAKLL